MEGSIEALKRFLYDEGPHTPADLVEKLGLSEYTVREALTLMAHEGLAETFRRGENGKLVLYWMYSGAELEAEAQPDQHDVI